MQSKIASALHLNILKKYFDDDLMSFSVPSSMFREMEDNVTGSFLGKKVWANFFNGNRDNNSNT